MDNLKKLKEAYGDVIELVGPSGFKYTIRQQTGEDDDIISNTSNALDGTAVNEFVQVIVIKTDMTPTGRLSLEDVLKMKLCDKYFIIIASRIFSIGQVAKFNYEWSKGLIVEYEEDLEKYIWDYSDTEKEFPEPGHKGYFKYRIKPHKFGKDYTREFTLVTGKRIKYDFVNGYGEKYLMLLPEDKLSKNQELFARNIFLFLNTDWVKIENFKNFTPKEMAEIRKDIFHNDPVLEIYTDLENPSTKEKVSYPLLASTDFFFPREI